MNATAPGPPLAVYVHFPYCRRRCPYCDFRVDVVREIPHERYADAILAELHARVDATEGRALYSLYFGGGTPSLWEARALARVVDGVRDRIPTSFPDLEVTVEVNPTARDPRLFESLREVGANRISLGVQAFEAARLESLGRLHSVAAAHDAIAAACDAGFERVSFDLICATPGQTMSDWLAELELAAPHFERSAVGHVSVYELTYHAGTPLEQWRKSGRITPVEDDAAADLLAATTEWLGAHGLGRYEISNFARPGHESRHNGAYWRGIEYLGLGVGAHSMRRTAAGLERRANGPRTGKFLDGPASAPHEIETVSPAEALVERLYLGLRTREGVDLEAICVQEGISLYSPLRAALEDGLAACEVSGWLERTSSSRWRPRPEGLDFADSVAVALLDAAEGNEFEAPGNDVGTASTIEVSEGRMPSRLRP